MKHNVSDDVWRKSVRRREIILIILFCIVGLTGIYVAWDVTTSRVSMQFSCTVHEIEYVNLTGDGKCLFALVQGNVSICGLPKDVQCSGVLQDVPIAKMLRLGG